jgi:hypothetical protein
LKSRIFFRQWSSSHVSPFEISLSEWVHENMGINTYYTILFEGDEHPAIPVILVWTEGYQGLSQSWLIPTLMPIIPKIYSIYPFRWALWSFSSWRDSW